MSLDELLPAVGAELDRLSSLRSELSERPPTPRRRTMLATAVIAILAATGFGVYAVARRDATEEAVSPDVSSVIEPASTSLAPVVSTPSAVSTPTTVGVANSTLTDTISVGSSGPDVTRLQQRLIDLGFALGPIDGVFGAATQQAVWAFKELVGGLSYQQLAADPHASDVTDQWWTQMAGSVSVKPRRPDSGRTHVEVYLPSQVLVVFVDNQPALIAHISSGELNDQGQPAAWCETTTYDTDSQGLPLPQPITDSRCATSKTPGGVFKVNRFVEGKQITDQGDMYNPLYFDYGIAIHGASVVPIEPASHGTIRTNMEVAHVLPTIVHVGDTVYVWGHDGKQPEEYTRQESLPSFPSPAPSPKTPGG